ncbi:YceI family protein [Frigidibacter sp. SD6-1]|uniref:YceI family protein n=1 Tax=Frigidibacter sp. SD6-1 TaxID=3032581 RepID=UPI0024DFD87D|nr:YceI family protein [Frigidibacter sp. SD6-1]
MKPLSTLAIAAALAAFTLPAIAADSYKVDPRHAWVTFSTNHAGWSSAHGIFRTVSGEIVFDQDDVTNSSVSFEIDAASVDTNLADRDEHLRSPDFLNVEEFPTITFKSSSVEKTGERTGRVTGDLTLVGMTKEVVLDVTWNAEQPLPWDPNVVVSGFSTAVDINGTDFGITKMTEFGLGPGIAVKIDVEAVRQ